MSSFQGFILVVTGQVTVISFAAALMIGLSNKNAARRYAVGLVGLVLVLCSPLLAGMLPASGWWRLRLQADAPRSSLDGSVPSERYRIVEERQFALSDIETMDRDAAKPPGPPVAQRSKQTNTAEAARGSIGTGNPLAHSNNLGKISLSGALNLAGSVWIAGCVVLLARWLWQYGRLQWLLRSLAIHAEVEWNASEAVKEEVCQALQLRHLPPIIVSDLVPMAMVLGIWRPRIVLPRELMECGDSTRLRDVLIHECAHVVRGDPWANAGQHGASILWWWHPGVHWLNRLMTQSREEVCDNFVLQCGDAPNYAQTLLELSELCTSRRDYATAIGLFGSRWTLESRIIGLLKPERNTMTTTKRTTGVLIAALLGAMCLLVGGVRGVDQPPPKSEAKERAEAAEPKLAEEEKDKTKVTPPANEVIEQKAKLKTVTGRVIDDKDQPVAGAQVWWVVSHEAQGGIIVKGTSDAEGRFSLSTPDIAPRLPSWANNTLWILHKGKQLATSPATLPEKDGKTPALLIRLQAETDTSFVVMSPDKKPLAGVVVEPWHFRTHLAYDIIPEEARKMMSVATNADGRAQMPNMPRKGFHSIRAVSDALGTQEIRLDSNSNPPAEQTLELQATGSVEGQLIASNPLPRSVAWKSGSAPMGSAPLGS